MVDNSPFSWDLFYEAPIIGIIRGLSMQDINLIARSYTEAGLSTLEITMNTNNAVDIITQLIRENPSLNIGAGTVCTLEDLDNVLKAGAQFIVTPIINEEVILKAVALDIPIFPGAYTPTEIYKAWTMGASAVKVFPASKLGPKYIKDVLAPLNDIKLLPTGGVNLENIKAFFEAGAVGVGMGSSLLHKKYIQEGNIKALAEHFLKFKNEIQEFSGG